MHWPIAAKWCPALPPARCPAELGGRDDADDPGRLVPLRLVVLLSVEFVEFPGLLLDAPCEAVL